LKGGIAYKKRKIKKIPRNTHKINPALDLEKRRTDNIAPIVRHERDRIKKLFFRKFDFLLLFERKDSLNLKKQLNISFEMLNNKTITRPKIKICRSNPLPKYETNPAPIE
jgi:hypothetical protein